MSSVFFKSKNLKSCLKNKPNSCAKAWDVKCWNNLFVPKPAAGMPLVWPSVTSQKAKPALSLAQQKRWQKGARFCSQIRINGRLQRLCCREQTGRGNGMRRVHQQACTAALPTDACRITRTPRSHGSSKSQTINSPRFGSVLNAQTVRSAGL